MELQIADILSVANSQLVCSIVISEYPKQCNKNYDPTSVIDNFWMNTCKTYFYESLLLTATLLNKDKRAISFCNWSNFANNNKEWLDQQSEEFKRLGLKTVRDQIVGHVDSSNHNNRMPRQRRQGVVNEVLIKNLNTILQSLIDKFDEFTRQNNNPYSRESFFGGDQAREEVELAISQAKPKLTNNFVI